MHISVRGNFSRGNFCLEIPRDSLIPVFNCSRETVSVRRTGLYYEGFVSQYELDPLLELHKRTTGTMELEQVAD